MDEENAFLMIRMKVTVIGIPLDLGANVRGSRYGPGEIRKYLFPLLKKKGVLYSDIGDVPISKEQKRTDPRKRNYREIERTCKNFSKRRLTGFPVILGGDHSITICLLRSMLAKKRTGLIYFDAHGDFNTPATTPSGNVHGMVVSDVTSGDGGNVVSTLCTVCSHVKERNVALVGTRDLDSEEKKALDKSKVTVMDMDSVGRNGIENAVRRALKIASKGTEKIHLSIDLDVVDPQWTPGVSTPVKGGLTEKQMSDALDILRGKISSLDIVEYVPSQDKEAKTAKFAADVVARLLNG